MILDIRIKFWVLRYFGVISVFFGKIVLLIFWIIIWYVLNKVFDSGNCCVFINLIGVYNKIGFWLFILNDFLYCCWVVFLLCFCSKYWCLGLL